MWGCILTESETQPTYKLFLFPPRSHSPSLSSRINPSNLKYVYTHYIQLSILSSQILSHHGLGFWYVLLLPRLPLATYGKLTGRISGENEDAHDQVYNQGGGYDNPNHEAKFSHELIAGGAAFEGFKLYEDHQRKEGNPALRATL